VISYNPYLLNNSSFLTLKKDSLILFIYLFIYFFVIFKCCPWYLSSWTIDLNRLSFKSIFTLAMRICYLMKPWCCFYAYPFRVVWMSHISNFNSESKIYHETIFLISLPDNWKISIHFSWIQHFFPLTDIIFFDLLRFWS